MATRIVFITRVPAPIPQIPRNNRFLKTSTALRVHQLICNQHSTNMHSTLKFGVELPKSLQKVQNHKIRASKTGYNLLGFSATGSYAGCVRLHSLLHPLGAPQLSKDEGRRFGPPMTVLSHVGFNQYPRTGSWLIRFFLPSHSG